jgi:cyclophilin family peptidyl-prolyl cis-trans isomerase
MNRSHVLLITVLAISLSACYQTQLGGPTGAATLKIALLRAPETVLVEGTTWDEPFWEDALGKEKWASANPLFKLLFMGGSNLNTKSLDRSSLYLITAEGGIDYAPEGGQQISAQPEVVQGVWHAIATGERIRAGNLQVSALTEATYQQVLERLEDLSDSAIVVQLDAAARLLVMDVDDSGSVDHSDVLAWTRTLHADKYLGDIRDVDALAAATRANQPASEQASLAKAVLGKRRLLMETNFGDITLETLNWEAPVTVDNFLRYVDDNFYDNIIFHRVINNFVIQAGLWELLPGTTQVTPKNAREPIRNESRYSIPNQRGTFAMARTPSANSATSQFFINQVDNPSLDYGSEFNPAGYAVFARLVSGLGTVDSIAALPTGVINGIGTDVPIEDIVVIESLTLVD